MQRESSKTLRPVVEVTEEQLRAAYDLVESIRAYHTTDNIKGSFVDKPTKVTVRLRGGERYTVGKLDELFSLDNLKSDPIEVIEIGERFGIGAAHIALGQSWHSHEGAALKVAGDLTITRDSVSAFCRIFDREKDIALSIMSLRSYVLAFILAVFIHFMLGVLSFDVLREVVEVAESNVGASIFGYVLFFWLTPILFLTLLIDILLWYYVGRAVFLWGDGKLRFDKRKKVLTFVFYTFPFAILTKILTEYAV